MAIFLAVVWLLVVALAATPFVIIVWLLWRSWKASAPNRAARQSYQRRADYDSGGDWDGDD